MYPPTKTAAPLLPDDRKTPESTLKQLKRSAASFFKSLLHRPPKPTPTPTPPVKSFNDAEMPDGTFNQKHSSPRNDSDLPSIHLPKQTTPRPLQSDEPQIPEVTLDPPERFDVNSLTESAIASLKLLTPWCEQSTTYVIT